MNNDLNLCPICKDQLNEITRDFHATYRTNGQPTGGQLGISAFCKNCNLPLKRRIIGVEFNSGWYSTDIEEKNIVVPNKPINIQLIEIETTRYKVALKKLNRFLKYKNGDDSLYFFEDEVNQTQGILLMRNDKPVLDYKMHKYLFDKLMKKHST